MTSGIWGELEMLWEHEQTDMNFNSFFRVSQTFTSLSIKQLDSENEISNV